MGEMMMGSSVVTARSSFIPPPWVGCCGVAHTTVPGDITPSPVPHPRGVRSGQWEEEVGGGPAVPSCAGWHGAGGSWTFPPPSTPSSLLLFEAELPAGSTAPGTHGSDFGRPGRRSWGPGLQTAPWSLLPWGGILLLLPPSSSSSSRSIPKAARADHGLFQPFRAGDGGVPSIMAQVSHHCPASRHQSRLSPPWGPSQPVLLPVLFPASFLSLLNCVFPSVFSHCSGF